MSLRAYQQTAARSENTRQTEYRLFGDVTRALIDAAKLDPTDFGGRIDALDWNRRMWSVLATDCGAATNTLPTELRAGIISLAMWVGKHTSLVVRGEEDINDLIEINRMIMQGLAGGTAQAA